MKYEEVYVKAYSGGREAKAGIDDYFPFYNTQRPHQDLGYLTPVEVLHRDSTPSDDHSIERKRSPVRELVDLGNSVGLSLNVVPNLSNS